MSNWTTRRHLQKQNYPVGAKQNAVLNENKSKHVVKCSAPPSHTSREHKSSELLTVPACLPKVGFALIPSLSWLRLNSQPRPESFVLGRAAAAAPSENNQKHGDCARCADTPWLVIHSLTHPPPTHSLPPSNSGQLGFIQSYLSHQSHQLYILKPPHERSSTNT